MSKESSHWVLWLRAARRAAAGAGALILGLALASCRERELSPMELQGLKRKTLEERRETLTEDEKIRIGTIQAREESEFNRAVERIIAERKAKGSPKKA